MLKRAMFMCFCAVCPAHAGLERYGDLLVADARPHAPDNAIRVTYLGTNGYQFETAHHALLVDPYFSRLNLGAYVLALPIQPNQRRVDAASRHLASTIDAIVITHGHVDHLFDVPAIMRENAARLIASPTAVGLAEAAGVPGARCTPVSAGDVRRVGSWKVTAIAAAHDRVYPIGVPFPGPRKNSRAPTRAADWVCGEPLAYLIETNGRRIYLDAGGTRALLPPAELGPVDLAILGVALPDSRARFAEAVRRLRPRFLLPSHQDNFFRSLDSGFTFGPLTDFPGVLREYRREQLPGRLILLDYFRSWTLR